MNPHALVIGDIDNDDKNEFVVGNLSGDLAIFKGKCEDGYPSYICRRLGTITCIAIGDVRNHGKNSVVVINAEGHAHIFDIPVKTNHVEQVSIDDYLKGGRRSSDTASVLAFKRMMSNNSYYTTHGQEQTKVSSSIYDLEKPNITLKVPVNVNKILIADIDGDNKNELILARTDRILHVFRLVSDTITEPKGTYPTLNNLISPSSSTINFNLLETKKSVTKYALSEINMWVFDGQISSLCTTTHPDKPNESLLLVAQPGNTFTIIDKDGKRFNRDFTPQYEQPQHNVEKEENVEMMKDDMCEMKDEAGNVFNRTNYIMKTWPTTDSNHIGQTGESSAVATEIVVGKRRLSRNTSSTNEIGILSMDGKFSIYDLKNKTISHRDLFVTHKLFSLATLDMSKPSVRSSIDYTTSYIKPSDSTEIHTQQSKLSQLKQSTGIEEEDENDESEESDESEEFKELEDSDESDESEYSNGSDSWDAASEGDETPGCDLFVACAWNGVTYLIDWSRKIDDSKIKYQLVKFAFEGRVCAFTAGLYAVDSEENLPCLFYVDFEDQIYVYYDVRISADPVNGFIDAIDDDIEEAIDRIIGIEGAIDSLIESEKNQQKNTQKKVIEEEEETIDLGDGWRGIANDEECGIIKQNELGPLDLADFIHECLYEFDSMKDRLEKEVLSFEQNMLSNRLPPAADIGILSDLNINLEPTLHNEIVLDSESSLVEGVPRKNPLYLITHSEESSDEFNSDRNVANWLQDSFTNQPICSEDE